MYSQNRISSRSIKQRLATEYDTHWARPGARHVQSEPKIRTYIKFKHEFSLKDYLSTFPPKHDKAFTIFIIGAHNLSIESGGYTRPPTP